MAEEQKEFVIEGSALLGALLIRNGYLTRAQLDECLQIYQDPDNELRLGDILVSKGYVEVEIIARAIKARDEHMERKRQQLAQAQRERVAATRRTIQIPPLDDPDPALQPAAADAPAASAEAVPATESPPAEGPPAAEPLPVEAPPAAEAPAATPAPAEDAKHLLQWLSSALATNISDLHIKTGQPLVARMNGELMTLKSAPLDRTTTERLLDSILTREQRELLQERKSVNLCLNLPEGGRARGNIYQHFRGLDAAFRLIPGGTPDLASLGLPRILAKFTTYAQGLVLVTGPAGSGKSTTLAALVDIVNQERTCHIITVEDPIEFVHECQRSLINERQVGRHTLQFSSALRAALREDPDVIVVGEMRDVETAHLTIRAAETGHLVFATLHTHNAVRSVNRVVDLFPPDEQPQIRTMLSESLRGVISQRLVPRADMPGRIPVVEVMFTTSAIANLIRERKTYQIPNLLKVSQATGSTAAEDHAAELHQQGLISEATLAACQDE